MNKNVKVSLSSYQKTDSGAEEIKVSALGTYSLINGRHFVKYNEKTDDGKENKVLLKFEENLLEMTKSGEAASTLVFEEGIKTEGSYRTPFGAFIITTDTIFINLEYELAIDGEFVADCKIYIELMF